MDFLPGAFDWEWEHRRAALLHELHMGKTTELDWDWPRRGGVAHLPSEDAGPSSFTRSRGRGGQPSFRIGRGGSGRPMRARFEALARGSQPVVVKLASYGGGARAAAMMDYVSRDGELAVENEAGERIAGRATLAELRSEWEHLFDNRAASRDIGVFHVTIDGASLTPDHGQDEAVREILLTGFGNRRFVYSVEETADSRLDVRGAVVLRDRTGERLTGDAEAAAIIQQRYEESDLGDGTEARFRFHGYGNGVRFGAARVRDLVERSDGKVQDETGRPIETVEKAGDLVQKEWRNELHSRRGRDVMHVIVSARAGTDLTAFQNAVRDFLGEEFAGHRYVFAMHDPSDDPKETGEGGKRPHIHAHAIVTMRSETGERIVTSPQIFREWRTLMAEKAREHGIDMELTDRRELASPPAYSRNQVRPVSYSGRTEHAGTSEAAQARYDAKRENLEASAGTERSRGYAAVAAEMWRELTADGSDNAIASFAADRINRIQFASQHMMQSTESAAISTDSRSNMVMLMTLTEIEEAHMREMTRPEFEAYEKRVEAVLTSVETSIGAWERKDFDEVAAAAREVVSIRRDYLEFTEQQQGANARDVERLQSDNDVWDRAVARHGQEIVDRGNDVMTEIEAARRSIDRTEQEGRNPSFARADLDRELERAARLAVAGNTWLQELAETDRDLRMAIETTAHLDRQSRSGEERSADGEEYGLGERSGTRSSDAVVANSSGEASGSAASLVEQRRNPVREDHAGAEGERDSELHQDHPLADDRKASVPQRDRGGQSAEQSASRSDPPQQHVPRLRELEREIEQRDEREHNQRER
jgi:relaxase-like protein